MSELKVVATGSLCDTNTLSVDRNAGLKADYVSGTGVLAQSIANIAPSATPAYVIPLVFATAGNGTWLTYLFATAAMVLVGANLNRFARRSASPGSLYSYILKGLGPNVAVNAGWALILAYVLTASAVLCGFVNYTNVLLRAVGYSVSPVLISLTGAGIAWYVACRDIRLSARFMLVLEAVSLVSILILAAVVLARNGIRFDDPQLTLQSVSPSGIQTGLVLAFFSFVGFESATSLGGEAKNPLRSIPRALTSSVIFVGIFFVLMSFTEISGFVGSPVKLNESDAPLALLASGHGLTSLGLLISIGALVSFWACYLASVNAGARVLYSMGRHGVFHGSVGIAHEHNQTPYVAVTITTVVSFLVPVFMIVFGYGLFDIYGWVGTIATYGFLLNYTLIAIAAPIYLHRERELTRADLVVSAATILVLLLPVVGSVYPVPPAPYAYFPWIFLAWLLVGGLWFQARKRTVPTVLAEIVTRSEDIHLKYKNVAVLD